MEKSKLRASPLVSYPARKTHVQASCLLPRQHPAGFLLPVRTVELGLQPLCPECLAESLSQRGTSEVDSEQFGQRSHVPRRALLRLSFRFAKPGISSVPTGSDREGSVLFSVFWGLVTSLRPKLPHQMPMACYSHGMS